MEQVNKTVKKLTTSGTFLFWVEVRQSVPLPFSLWFFSFSSLWSALQERSMPVFERNESEFWFFLLDTGSLTILTFSQTISSRNSVHLRVCSFSVEYLLVQSSFRFSSGVTMNIVVLAVL